MDFQEFADNFDTIGPSLAMELMRLDKEKEKEKKASEDNTKPSSSKLGARMLAERNQHGKKTKNRNNHDSDWIDKRVSNKEDRRKASIETEATVENSLTPQSPQEKDEKSTARTNRKKSFAKNVALPSGSVNAASPMSSVTLSQSPLKSKRDKWDRRKETALYEGYSSDSEDSDREEDKKIPAKATSQTNISEARAGKPILNLPWMKKKLQKQEDSDSSSSGWSDAEETPPIAIRKKGDRRDSQSSKTESRFDQKKSPEPKMDSSEESPHLESPGEIPHTKREASSSESPRASEESLRETPQASKESHGAKKESSSEQKKSPNKSSKEKASKRPSKCAEQRNRRRDAKNPLICDEKKRNEFENSREDIAKRQQFEHQRGVEDLWTDDEGASQNQGGPIQGLEVDAERVDKIYEDLLTGFDNSVSRFDDHDDSSDEENDQMDTEWEGIPHPNLKRPIFGPFNERGPLVLSEEEQHEVPFALNRYLLDYQQEGIRFLYRSIVEGEGCILADDMGLGKTVQVISTLAAFFRKTGTNLDKKILRRNKSKAFTFQSYFQLEKDRRWTAASGIIKRGDEQGIIDRFKREELGLSSMTPVLLVVPAVVVDNWDYEFTLWGHFSVARYREQQHRDAALDWVKYGAAEVLLCPHSLFGSKDHFKWINQIQWKIVVVDEYHTFKSERSELFKNLKKLKQTSQCKIIGLTGTPMQNRHEELFNLIDAISPGYLGVRKEFNKQVSKPIMLGRAANAPATDTERGEKKQKELVDKLRPMYLQRLKTVVLKDEMPEKFEKVVFCELSELQKEVYARLLDSPDYILLRGANAPCDCGINKNYFADYKRLKTTEEKIDYVRKHSFVKRSTCCYKTPVPYRGGKILKDAVLWKCQHPDGCVCDEKDGVTKCPTCIFLPALMKLYQLSSHVSLLQVDKKEKSESRTKQEAFAKVAFKKVIKKLPGGDIYRNNSCWDDHFAMSGKMQELHKLLTYIASKKGRVLLFSYSTQTLDVIENYLKGNESYKFLRIDGQTPAKDRQGLVNDFQTDSSYFVMLLSTRAAGVGLNLTAANNVIIFDCEWNPALDSQAQDRSFRIGQKRDVTVYRLVAQGTIDELKYLRQIYKLQLKEETFRDSDESMPKCSLPKSFKGVEKDKDRKGELFGMENLLSFQKDGSFLEKMWGQSSSLAKDSSAVKSVEKKVHDATELAKVLQTGDTGKLNQQSEWELVRVEIEKQSSRMQDHGMYLSKAKYVDDPDKHLDGEARQINEFADKVDDPPAMSQDPVAISQVFEESQPVTAAATLPTLEDSSEDEAPTPVITKKRTASTSKTASSSQKKFRTNSSLPAGKRNFSLCGIPVLDMKKKKTTFGKADFFIPKKKKTK